MDTQGTNMTLDSGLGARGAGWRPPETWTGKREGEKQRDRAGGGGSGGEMRPQDEHANQNPKVYKENQC